MGVVGGGRWGGVGGGGAVLKPKVDVISCHSKPSIDSRFGSHGNHVISYA